MVYPDNLERDELALICFNLEKEVALLRHCPREVGVTEVARTAAKVRQSVKDHFCDQQEWPSNVPSLQGGSTEVPEVVDTFLHHLFSGSDSPLTDRMTWLKRSVAQDLVFAITRGCFKLAKHILLPSAVKSLTGKGRRDGHSCRPQSICEDDNNSRKSSIAHARVVTASSWPTTIFLGNEQWLAAQN